MDQVLTVLAMGRLIGVLLPLLGHESCLTNTIGNCKKCGVIMDFDRDFNIYPLIKSGLENYLVNCDHSQGLNFWDFSVVSSNITA